MATMLDYNFHYPLSPIQSASHNIHPAFRNDPEYADVINVEEPLNKSTAMLVPPPRNPLRLAVKPLFSTSITEITPSSLPDSPEVLTPPAPDLLTPDSPAPPLSSISSDPLPTYQQYDPPHPSEPAPSLPLRPQHHNHNHKNQPLLLTHHSPFTSTSPTLSHLPCPPSLPPQEWTLFLHDLHHASSLSAAQKALCIALALALPLGCPIIRGLVLCGAWRHQRVKNVRVGLEDGEGQKRKRGGEGVEGVVERWNERWMGRGVRVRLEVRGREEGKRGRGRERARLSVVVEEVDAPVGKGIGEG